MKATFEEKTYESYFNTELARRSSIYYPIGQAQEGLLGFDSSAYTYDAYLWTRFGFPHLGPTMFDGMLLREIADELEHVMTREIDHIPNQLKVNVLFQYKRPEYITRSNGKHWVHWSSNYFRYEIYKEQQNLLKIISDEVGNKVLVVYACPALYDHNDLIDTQLAGEIIDKSHFTRASQLSGHHWNTFRDENSHSMAFSDPEQVGKFDLLNFLTERSRSESVNSDQSNRYFIINFRKQIEAILMEEQYYSRAFKAMTQRYEQYAQYQLLHSYLIMYNVKLLTGLQWCIGY